MEIKEVGYMFDLLKSCWTYHDQIKWQIPIATLGSLLLNTTY